MQQPSIDLTVTGSATGMAEDKRQECLTQFRISNEIRRVIYKHLFDGLTLIVIDQIKKQKEPGWCFSRQPVGTTDVCTHYRDMTSKEKQDSHPHILMTCHKIRDEALPVLSASLTLHCNYGKAVALNTQVPSYYLKRITIMIQENFDWGAWSRYKARLPSLETLQIGSEGHEMSISTHSSDDYDYGDKKSVLAGDHDTKLLHEASGFLVVNARMDFRNHLPPFQLKILIRKSLAYRVEGIPDTPDSFSRNYEALVSDYRSCNGTDG